MKKVKFILGMSLTLIFGISCSVVSKSTVHYLKDYKALGDLTNDDLYMDPIGLFPSTGNVHVPVFLVDFPDYPSTNIGITKDQIEASIFGDPKEESAIGWESLNSFYKKSSNGQLNITGDIYDWFRYSGPSTELSDKGSNMKLFNEIFDYYDPTVDFSKYDSNNDGYIDSIYFIYSRPFNADTNFWAYKHQLGNRVLDGKTVYRYVWMSRQFFDPASENSSYYIKGLNAETIIHETGHLLGISDYYDYEADIGPGGGLGGPTMMDHNIGDIDSFSKLILGWNNPYYLKKPKKGQKFNLTLRPSSSGDSLIISPDFNGNIFDDFFLIDFYVPTGLDKYLTQYFTKPGIRMYHIGASIQDQVSNGVTYKTFAYNNTDTTNKFIKLMEKSGSFTIEERDNKSGTGFKAANDDCLYYEGDTFGVDTWKEYYLYNLMYKEFTFTMKVNSITSAGANITIEITNNARKWL